MSYLSHQHLHQLTAALLPLYQPCPAEAFPQHALQSLATIVPAEASGYNEVHLTERHITFLLDPTDSRFPDDEAIWAQYMHEHPVLTHYQRTGDGGAWRVSDFLSQRQFHRLALYNECYRRLRANYHIAVKLDLPPSTLVIAFAFNRNQIDFSDSERDLLNLLRPHLTQAYSQSQTLSEMQHHLTALERGLDLAKHGVIQLSSTGRVHLITPKARQWVEDYIAPFSPHQPARLPDALAHWVQQQCCFFQGEGIPLTPRQPLVIIRPGRTLTIRLIFDPERAPSLLLLREQQTEHSPTALAPLGLSKRECEILYGLLQGKTNPEIASMLGLSRQTIRSRLEDIFRKLGVTTRTAAALRAREVLS